LHDDMWRCVSVLGDSSRMHRSKFTVWLRCPVVYWWWIQQLQISIT
jgi:hypothetical protein